MSDTRPKPEKNTDESSGNLFTHGREDDPLRRPQPTPEDATTLEQQVDAPDALPDRGGDGAGEDTDAEEG